ncbi:MAG: tetraether lipid synthase Tes [Candidatus Thorarchaeota archaeon]|nr:MAG: radical SAM protein [Candidatus Thorarchaeota archaeon]RLI57691.1 MAG: radical SAM protein [Candidatus Thorarchaeota archaeon]
MRELPYTTQSICPECFLENDEVHVIDATLYEEDGKVMYKKTCEKHGEFIDVYWGDVEMFKKAQKWWYKSIGLDNPRTKTVKGCPEDCGQCPEHKSHTALALLDVTNRCNLRCPICFAVAAEGGTVYEPTPEQVLDMLKNLRSNLPVPAPAIQFAGGEPTVSKHLPQYIKWAKQVGFRHVQIASNVIRIGKSKEYLQELRDAGLSTIYMQFDGVTEGPYLAARGTNLLPLKMKAIQNAREVGMESLVLVPTVVRGVNDDQLGKIIEFAVENRDVVRCVNFQPVSITGRIDHEARNEMRITIPDCIHMIEEQTGGKIPASEWYPVPSVMPVGRALGLIKGGPELELSSHFACGMATFIFIDEDGSYRPITEIIDVDKLLVLLEEIANLFADGKRGARARAKAKLAAGSRYIKKKGILKDLVSLFLDRGDYDSLAQFMRRVIMLGMMHFQDPYNFDLERVQHCDINYAVPDGRIVPFCTMNTIHRSRVEEKFSVTVEEWRTGHKPTVVEEESISKPYTSGE